MAAASCATVHVQYCDKILYTNNKNYAYLLKWCHWFLVQLLSGLAMTWMPLTIITLKYKINRINIYVPVTVVSLIPGTVVVRTGNDMDAIYNINAQNKQN